MPVLFGGRNLPPLGEIGLTDLPKSGGAMAPPAPPGTTGLPNCHTHQYVFISVHLVNRTYYILFAEGQPKGSYFKSTYILQLVTAAEI